MMCVSRAHCNMTLFLRHVAVQTRDRQKGGVCYGPGSAAHHERARRRAQRAHAALRPGHTTDLLISERAPYAGELRRTSARSRSSSLTPIRLAATATPTVEIGGQTAFDCAIR